MACKHQLAVKVATATNACVESEVTDLLMAQPLLEAYARGGGGREETSPRKRRLRAVTKKRACTSHALR